MVSSKLLQGGAVTVPDARGLTEETGLFEQPRRAAIACYLSASDGWRDAGQHLSGAFADEPKAETMPMPINHSGDGS